jgi:hypothetical protein
MQTDMTTNRHKYFRWTRRTAWISFAYVILVPAMLGTAGYMTEVSGTVETRLGQWNAVLMLDRANGRCAGREGEI